MTFGLTPQGFNSKRLADIKQDMENAFVAEFGNVNLDPQSVVGQLIGVISKTFADLWDNLADTYYSQYPNSASGISLDNVVQLNGITRIAASQTSVTATCNGLDGTLIPENSQARLDNSNEIFYTPNGGVISSQNANFVNIVASNPPLAQAYTVIISGQSYTYARPTILFANTGAIFVTGNVITVTLNGTVLPPIPFNVSSNQTLSDINDAIAAFPTVQSTTKTNPDSISIFSILGFNTTVTHIEIVGGASQASYSITYTAPPSMNAISERLSALINEVDNGYTATDLTGGVFTVESDISSIPFNAAVGSGLSITDRSSPILFLSSNFGPIPCPANTLNTIITPIAGWNSITNNEEGITGRFIETDAELRIRRKNSIGLLGNATVEAIRSRILQNVPGVISCLVFENRTLTQEPFIIVFSTIFDGSDIITVTYDTIYNFAVPYNTDQATTMSDLASAFEALFQVDNAVVSGGDQTLTVILKTANQLEINSVTTDVSLQDADIKGGRPPKSFEAVVEGGINDDIANTIWLSKPAGIETFGNVNGGSGVPITDSQGDTQIIHFSRPTEVYISVEVVLTLYTEETFPPNGTSLVAQSIYNYGESLGIGVDVLIQRVLAQIFNVSGIASGSMQIAATVSATGAPVYGTSDIIIQENEISVFSIDRIFVTVA